VNPRTEVTTSVRGVLLDLFVADHLAVVRFLRPLLVDQEVGVTDHLGEGEESLGYGDVA
jgi:hypothetical protein